MPFIIADGNGLDGEGGKGYRKRDLVLVENTNVLKDQAILEIDIHEADCAADRFSGQAEHAGNIAGEAPVGDEREEIDLDFTAVNVGHWTGFAAGRALVASPLVYSKQTRDRHDSSV
jgi:hypothetical protein